MRIALKTDDDAARFFGGYSEALELKDEMRTNLMRRPNFFSFDTPNGGVFIRCFGSECMIAEGTTRELFDAMTKSLNWPAGPMNTIDGGPGVIAALPQHAPAQGNTLARNSANQRAAGPHIAACLGCRAGVSKFALPVH